jgi:putative inorganic carbon (HCO3(-)) transporter
MAIRGSRWSQKVVQGAILGFALFAPWSIAGAQACLGLGLLVWVARLIVRRHADFVLSPLGWPILALLGVELISALFAPQKLTGLRSLRAEWIVLLFFLVVSNVRRRQLIQRILDILVAVTALVCLYAIWQHFAGWDIYRDRPLRSAGSFFEATGVFGHHLTFGGFVMVVLLTAGCLFFWGTEGRRKALYGLASLTLGLALIFSYARSAWLGLLGGVLAIGLLRGKKVLILGLIGILLLAGGAYLVLPSVRMQVGGVRDLFQDPMAKSSRLQMWSATLRIIRDHPLLGVGLGHVKTSLVAYGCDLGYSHVHNDLLNVATNAGLLGLAAFLWVWVTFLRLAAGCHGMSEGDRFARSLAAAGFGLMIAFLVAGLFQCYYTDSEDGMILWFLLGLVTAICGRGGKLAEASWRATSTVRGNSIG